MWSVWYRGPCAKCGQRATRTGELTDWRTEADVERKNERAFSLIYRPISEQTKNKEEQETKTRRKKNYKHQVCVTRRSQKRRLQTEVYRNDAGYSGTRGRVWMGVGVCTMYDVRWTAITR